MNFPLNKIHLAAIVLVLLTLLSTWLSQLDTYVPGLVIIVTLSVMIKGQQIVDVFMELNHAPPKWRGLLLSYVLLIPLILALIIYL